MSANAVIPYLENEIHDHEEAILHIRKTIDVVRKRENAASPSSETGMSTRDAVLLVLRERKKPMRESELFTRLTELGVHLANTPGREEQNMKIVITNNRKLFWRDGEMVGLKEWRPAAHQTAKKAKKTTVAKRKPTARKQPRRAVQPAAVTPQPEQPEGQPEQPEQQQPEAIAS